MKAALGLARVWGYVAEDAVRGVEALLFRVQQMLWRLTQGRGG